MAEPEILFEVDASKILAKLHLAGLMPCKYDKNKEFIVNSGIKNDDPNAKPENPGKVEFDLGNSQGEYEIGFVTEANFNGSANLNGLLLQFNEMVAKMNVKPEKEDKEDKEDKGLLDKEEKRALNDKKTNDLFKKFFIDVEKLFELNLKKLQEVKFDYSKFVSEFILYVNGKREKDLLIQTMNELSNNEFLEFVDKMRASLQEAGKLLEKSSKGSSHDAERAEAFKLIMTYMTVFAGEDKAKGITADSLVEVRISDKVKDSNDSNLVKNFEIVSASELEIAKMNADNEANPDKAVDKICFKTGYTILLDK